jgi:hypothetical protein
MSRTTQAPASILDYGDGIGRELDDLKGIAALCDLARANRHVLDLNKDERAAMFALIIHAVERLDEKVNQVESALRKEEAEA